ncbi:MAG: NAD(P)-dependent alcohol dehydrogenase [Marinoscillum sp.]
MKAIIFEHYGAPDVLKFVELDKPVPQPNEVLVKVNAAALNAADWHVMRGKPYFMRLMFGLTKPKINRFGCDLAGVVESVGEEVEDFKIGDEVYGEVTGKNFDGFGAFREYLCVSPEDLTIKPTNLSFEEAAAVPLAAMSALQGLRKGNLRAGEHLLINGASGGVGTYAVQLAKVIGAKVTAVCSTSKMDLVKSLGADEVIDYKAIDFVESGMLYDMIFAVNGTRPLMHYKKALKPQGRYVMCGGGNRQLFEVQFLGGILSKKNGQQFHTLMAKSQKEDMIFLKELIESGDLKPVIDRTYPLKETSKAMEYLEEGHARGKIVLHIAN